MQIPKKYNTFMLLLFVTLFSFSPVSAQQQRFVRGEVLVKFKANMQATQIQSALSNAGLSQRRFISQIGVYQCDITNQKDVHTAVQACRESQDVEYAEPNYIYAIPEMASTPRATPNDPRFDDLWGLHSSDKSGIDAAKAWEVQKGSKNIIVAIIDTGMDYDHEDLRDNIWRNPGETGDGKENNGIDDDNNGFVDDARGWNFERDTKDPADSHGHGSHVAGTVGAVGNNGKGVVGVNWQVTLMPLRFIGTNGFGEADDAIRAIIYAADNGANIMSNSWGGDPFMQSMEDAIRYARDKNVLFVAAAGNDDRDNDRFFHYPSNYQVENVIAVAAANASDGLANFSNTGREMVDLSAPGVNILSTFGQGGYQFLDGTSMATPHVSGVAALIMAQYPGITYRQTMIRIFGGVERKSTHSGFMVTGGRLNAFNSLSTDPLIGFVTDWLDTLFTEGPYLIDAEAVDDGQIASMTLVYSINGGEQQILAMQNTGADKFRASIPGQPQDSNIAYFVEAKDGQGNTGRSRVFTFKIAERSGGGGCGCASAGSASGARASGLEMIFYLALLIGLVWRGGRRKR
ncbi:MAG: S8 family peptidase [bacterium]